MSTETDGLLVMKPLGAHRSRETHLLIVPKLDCGSEGAQSRRNLALARGPKLVKPGTLEEAQSR